MKFNHNKGDERKRTESLSHETDEIQPRYKRRLNLGSVRELTRVRAYLNKSDRLCGFVVCTTICTFMIGVGTWVKEFGGIFEV